MKLSFNSTKKNYKDSLLFKKNLHKNYFNLKCIFILNFLIPINIRSMESNEEDFYMGTPSSKRSSAISAVANGELRVAENSVKNMLNWLENPIEENFKNANFELVNKSSQDIFVALANGVCFYNVNKLPASKYTNLNYSACSAIIKKTNNKFDTIIIYIWFESPEIVIQNNKVINPKIIHKITSGADTVFLTWDGKLRPQTGGGFMGINNWLSLEPKNKISYLNRSLENNLSQSDITIIKNEHEKLIN